uniref:CYtochrome P450 family n=1 Tax=Caenorhabditis japonica TaxID=281687 RepID=A0A8R1HT42_CAEJA
MLLLLVLLTSFAFLAYHLHWKRRNLPPGPMPIPFIGNLLSMAQPQPGYECFRRWTKQYGDVYTFWLGSTPYVIISSYSRIKETFIKDGDTYVNKKAQPFQHEFRGGEYGVIETNGQFWSTHRRFALHQLRDFGLGKDVMQQRILIEVQEIFETVDKALDTEVDVPNVLRRAVANVINQLIFGYRFDCEKEHEFLKMQELLEFQENAFKEFRVILEVFAPSVGKFLPGPNVNEILLKFKTDFFEFFEQRIEEHRSKIDFDAEDSQDYAESYLKEQKKREADGDFDTFSNKQFSNMCLDLWFAGLATTTTTLTWAIGYLLNYPNYLVKVQEEMDRVIGSDRLITSGDKVDLPYTTAVINESQRCANIVPINLFHETTRDTVIDKYSIPACTGVIAQISTIMLDESVFPEPYKFNPDRFIDENGKLKKVDELCPFSVGKRQCLGEGLARMELFLFLSNFLNRYEVKPSPTQGLPCIDKSKEFGVTPRKFDAVLKKRYS